MKLYKCHDHILNHDKYIPSSYDFSKLSPVKMNNNKIVVKKTKHLIVSIKLAKQSNSLC